MGVPIGPGISPSQQMAALLSKARSSFHATYQVLHSNAAIHDRVRLLQKIVWTAMAWAAGIVMPSQTITNMINSVQWDCISSMAKFRRRSHEFYVDFRTRACRSSRAILFASKSERWGTLQIRMFWRLAGHRARGTPNAEGGAPSAATILTHARDLQWWRQQQGLVEGLRHRRRHYARLMGEAREISAVACEPGESWHGVALNRSRWAGLEKQWVLAKDRDWAAGRQLCLEAGVEQ